MDGRAGAGATLGLSEFVGRAGEMLFNIGAGNGAMTFGAASSCCAEGRWNGEAFFESRRAFAITASDVAERLLRRSRIGVERFGVFFAAGFTGCLRLAEARV